MIVSVLFAVIVTLLGTLDVALLPFGVEGTQIELVAVPIKKKRKQERKLKAAWAGDRAANAEVWLV